MIICTHFKCKIFWALTNVSNYVTTTSTKHKTFSSLLKFSHVPFLFIPPLAVPGICWSKFQDYRFILPSLELHVHGIILYSFCVWSLLHSVFLKSTCVDMYTIKFFSIITEYMQHTTVCIFILLMINVFIISAWSYCESTWCECSCMNHFITAGFHLS